MQDFAERDTTQEGLGSKEGLDASDACIRVSLASLRRIFCLCKGHVLTPILKKITE